MLIDDGLLQRTDDGDWTASDGLAEVRIPASISALLSARLERLAPDERAVAERASVVGRVFEQAAVAELATDALRPEVGRSLLAPRAQGAGPTGTERPDRGRRVQVPAHPHPRRRLRGAPEVRAGDPARALRRLARADRRRAAGRVRGDRRLPPRAGPPLPDRARREWLPDTPPGRPGRSAPSSSRRPCLRSRRHGRGRDVVVAGDTRLSDRFDRATGADARPGSRAVLDWADHRGGRAARGRSHRGKGRRGTCPGDTDRAGSGPRADPVGRREPGIAHGCQRIACPPRT